MEILNKTLSLNYCNYFSDNLMLFIILFCDVLKLICLDGVFLAPPFFKILWTISRGFVCNTILSFILG